MKTIVKKRKQIVYKRYAPVRMNPEALAKFLKRKEDMEKIVNGIVKKKKKITISFPRFFDILAEVPTSHINDEFILKMIRGRKRL